MCAAAECAPTELDSEDEQVMYMQEAGLYSVDSVASPFSSRASSSTASTNASHSDSPMSLSPGDMAAAVVPMAAAVSEPARAVSKRARDEDVPEHAAPQLPEVARRRRLSHKQPPGGPTATSGAGPMPGYPESGIGIWEGYEQICFASHRDRYLHVYHKFRRWLRHRISDMPRDEKKDAFGKLANAGLYNWKVLSGKQKQELMFAFLNHTSAPRLLRVWAQATWADHQLSTEDKKERYFLYCRSVLLTWNGDWGVLPDGFVEPGTEWREVVQACIGAEQVQRVWTSFSEHVDRVVALTHVTDWASSLELCVDTWEKQGQVRVHTHLYLKSAQSKMYVQSSEPMALFGSLPHKRHNIAHLQQRASGSYCGLYYLSCPKIGMICQRSSLQPYKDYPVSSAWIFSLLQADKMELEPAREELVRVGKGLTRLLADWEKLAQVRREDALRDRIQHVREQVALQDRALRSFPEIDEWKRAAQQPYQRRKKFLVLDGPSGVGKTQYVKGLFGAERVLELNCASCGSSPDMRQFRADVHDAVLFDEGSVKLVLENRKLFQAPPCLVDLGHSPTGRDVYRVFLNDAVLVIASNRWVEDWRRLENRSDYDWIAANQVLVCVSERMYVS